MAGSVAALSPPKDRQFANDDASLCSVREARDNFTAACACLRAAIQAMTVAFNAGKAQ
jgi:hypothetical protein